MVSFVLPAYKSRFLSQAMESILNQSETDWELVIVNDASPENVREIALSYSDNRIRYYENEKNIGGGNLVAQWNHCIEYAQGDWIVLASDDDVYHPDFLKECLLLAAKYPSIDLVHARVRQIDEMNSPTGVNDGILDEYTGKFEYFSCWMKSKVLVCIGNYMFRADTLKKKKFIDFPSAFGSDSATVIMMSENGVANTVDQLYDYRVSSIHLSSSNDLRVLHNKLVANTMQFQFFDNLGWEKPIEEKELLHFDSMSKNKLYEKCKYDYYNLVIRYLPASRLVWIKDCSILKTKDKIEMFLRYMYDRLFK